MTQLHLSTSPSSHIVIHIERKEAWLWISLASACPFCLIVSCMNLPTSVKLPVATEKQCAQICRPGEDGYQIRSLFVHNSNSGAMWGLQDVTVRLRNPKPAKKKRIVFTLHIIRSGTGAHAVRFSRMEFEWLFYKSLHLLDPHVSDRVLSGRKRECDCLQPAVV